MAAWFGDNWLGGLVPDSVWAQVAIGLGVLIILVLMASWLTDKVALTVARRMLKAIGQEQWSEALHRHRVFRYIGYLVPLLVLTVNVTLLPITEKYVGPVSRFLQAVSLVYFFLILSRLLKAWLDMYAATTRAQTRSIKGYVELARIALWCICIILVFSLLIDRSPLLMLSGLGALSAVLLLVFKDTLLSLVASTQMTSNDMLRIGDWIEMPQANADGFVIDIALHTVKVQNWDKTVTTIPTYKLFSESYRNWRHMFESGGRRIKRTMRINAATVRFLTEDEVRDLSRFNLLKDYLAGKEADIQESNLALGEAAADPVNRRRLTNLGTFRAYALAYLKQHRELRQDMLMIVRMMEPESEGIPVEVYCFSANTAWVEYERIQGDVFDHLLAILPELSLQLYQAPSGADFVYGLQGVARQVEGPRKPISLDAG
ncbi:MAG TPA: mechanosensitive ion channel domain-containing protein [Pusillimonas sp.]|uniref:mechanosensitive ion channel family protein n=1 Tax=Pusillimonas sp. TaxID=3040095 RepID=UPI002B6E0FE8|nr:mechanosensitive ion channel domain-containing protein [Pusillimonas sp.]HUH86774.1 mechanosensitive ion channel domain-containing protein [Pusillimonas sp.]